METQSTRTHYDVLADWARVFHFFEDHLNEIKVIFDGYAEHEDGSPNESLLSYAVFIHKRSAEEGFLFPEHDQFGRLVIHRPDEEVCLFVWLDEEGALDDINDIQPEDAWVEDIIVALDKRYPCRRQDDESAAEDEEEGKIERS